MSTLGYYYSAFDTLKLCIINRNEPETMTPVPNDDDVGYDWNIKVFVKQQHHHIVITLQHSATLLYFFASHRPTVLTTITFLTAITMSAPSVSLLGL